MNVLIASLLSSPSARWGEVGQVGPVPGLPPQRRGQGQVGPRTCPAAAAAPRAPAAPAPASLRSIYLNPRLGESLQFTLNMLVDLFISISFNYSIVCKK